MTNYTPLNVLPVDIQNDFGAQVFSATPTGNGCFRLVDARRTKPKDFESQRITVRVVDEDGQALEGVPVAFSFSTADRYNLTNDFQWQPPTEDRGGHRAFLVRTSSAGVIDMILGPEGVVQAGGAGGVTVFILTPELSSDFVTGCGMLADHTGMFLTFQRRKTGVIPQSERLDNIEARLAALEAKRTESKPGK